MTAIVDIIGREILDSRGNPTVEVDVMLEDGSRGRAGVPSGASTGAHEAVELRDGDKKRYLGKGVRNAIDAVNGEIFDAFGGMDAEAQVKIDETMIALDGTPNKGRLGRQCHPRRVARRRQGGGGGEQAAALSLCRRHRGSGSAGADDEHHQWRGPCRQSDRLSGIHDHAARRASFPRLCAPGRKFSTRCGRRSRPPATTPMWAMRAALRPICRRRKPRSISSFQRSRKPATARRGRRARARSGGERILQGRCLCLRRGGQDPLDRAAGRVSCRAQKRYPIVSIEDGMAEDDFDGWKMLTQKIGDRCQLVGDDIFVTNVARLSEGIKKGIGNSILVKVNQIGTFTETLAAVETAHKAGYTAVMSHRSGETEDFDHRGPRGRHQLRSDQNRVAGALRPHREIQSATAHRRRAWRAGGLSRSRGIQGLSDGRDPFACRRPRRPLRPGRVPAVYHRDGSVA